MEKDEWKKHRSRTFMNVLLMSTLFGMFTHMYHPTEFYYFKDTMNLKKDADFYYGCSWAVLAASGVTFCFIGGYYYDKTSNIREIFLFTGVISVLGNILYLIYFSPYIVLLGQFFTGITFVRMVAATGELAQIYKAEDLGKVYALYGLFGRLGAVLGACLIYAFNLVDTHIDNWKLNVNTMVGVVMGSLYLLQLVIAIFTLNNTSKEFNLKKETSLLNDDEEDDGDNILTKEKQSESNIDNLSFTEKYLLTLRSLLRHKEVLFLFWLCFLYTFARSTLLLLYPIKSSFYVGWTQTDMSTLNLISSIFGAIPSAMLCVRLAKIVNPLGLLMFTLITIIISLVSMCFLSFPTTYYVIAVLLYTSGVIGQASASAFMIISRTILANAVPYDIQAITESIRSSIFQIAYLVAGLSITLFSVPSPLGIVIIIGIFVLSTGWLTFQYKQFSEIKMVSIRQNSNADNEQ